MTGDGSARIVVVCAANVCRSPMAELTLRRAFAALPSFGDVVVESGGVATDGGQRICPDVAAFDDDDDGWRELTARHRSRPLDPEHVRRASLVLTASRGIRASVVAAVPEQRRRVFTLAEAEWLGEGFEPDPAAPGAAAVAAFLQHIDGSRGMRQPPTPARQWPWQRRPGDPLDIQDGHTMSVRAHRETVRSVDERARAIAARIAGVHAVRG